MHILVKANQAQRAALLQKKIPAGVQVYWFEENNHPIADAYFDFLYETEGPAFQHITDKPVFVNAVIPLWKTMPVNFIRFNAWPFFWERSIIELVNQESSVQQTAEKTMQQLNFSFIWCPDMPGMIAARIIAVIINEAYFCLGDGVSTKDEIDTAMRLGTNYILGPFEWAEKIGVSNIVSLLEAMQQQSSQYQVAPLLLESIHTTY